VLGFYWLCRRLSIVAGGGPPWIPGSRGLTDIDVSGERFSVTLIAVLFTITDPGLNIETVTRRLNMASCSGTPCLLFLRPDPASSIFYTL
jgi:hypothetical protein